MYILFEVGDSRYTNPVFVNYEAVGYTDTEESAIKWVEENVEYRSFKYCPKKLITLH